MNKNQIHQDDRKKISISDIPELYASIVKASPTSIVITNPRGDIEYVNPKFTNLTGYSYNEAIGQNPRILKSGYTKPKEYKTLWKTITKGEEWKGEFHNKKKNGELYWELASISSIKNVHGKISHFIAIKEDITDRKKTEEELRESEHRFRLMADGSPMIIWVTDSDGNLQFVNNKYLTFFGIRNMKQIKDYKWQMLMHPEDSRDYINKFLQAYKKRVSFIAEARVRRADGKWRWIASQAEPRFTPDGKFQGYIGISPDITDRKIIEQQKDEFLNIASHELKTPVTSIKAYGQILQNQFKQNNLSNARNLLSKLDFQVNKLTSLVNDFMDVNKTQAGKLQFREEYFDFNALVNDIVEDMQRTTLKHKIIKKLAPADKIYGDKNRIGQIIINFLSNAINYSPRADKIIVKSQLNKKFLTFSVQDFGIGISEESKKKIFDRYYQADTIVENNAMGFGLGLYIASEIVKKQKGKIWVESEEGIGSTFFCRLPLSRTTAPSSSTASSTTGKSTSRTGAERRTKS